MALVLWRRRRRARASVQPAAAAPPSVLDGATLVLVVTAAVWCEEPTESGSEIERSEEEGELER